MFKARAFSELALHVFKVLFGLLHFLIACVLGLVIAAFARIRSKHLILVRARLVELV